MPVSPLIRLAPLLGALLVFAACRAPEAALSLALDGPLVIDGRAGRTTPANLVLANAGSADLHYQLETEAAWLALSGRSGTLAPGERTVVRLQAACPADSAGEHEGVIAITTDDAARLHEVVVQLVCSGAPKLELSGSLELSARVSEAAEGRLELANAGSDTLEYEVQSEESWLEVTGGARGTVAPQEAATVTVSGRCGREGGVQSGFLLVTSNDELKPAETVVVTLLCESHLNDGFDIELRFTGLSANQEAVFQEAAERWQRLIQGDLPDWRLAKKAGECGTPEALDELVDDLLIAVEVSEIDGEGELIAVAGPCRLRGVGAALPVYGTLRLDAADLPRLEQEDALAGLALHELGHVLGFGHLWLRPEHDDLIDFESEPPGESCDQAAAFAREPSYLGAYGLEAYRALGGEGPLPLAGPSSPSAACIHWSEAVFGNELMTPLLAPGGEAANPLSRLTAAALADLGYAVDLDAADPYELPACSPSCGAEPQGALLERVLQPATGTVD